MGKIAVFTVFRNTNYGAVLQAYALTRVLGKLTGRETFLIDFIPDNVTNLMHNGILYHGRHGRKSINAKSLKKAVLNLVNFTGTVARTRVFLDFISRHLPVHPHPFFSGDPIHLEGFDCAFVGSDQIWNPGVVKKFHDAYFGITAPKLERVVAYAPSFGKSSFSEAEMGELARKLENVDVLSCREEQGCRLVERLTGRHVEQIADPTFLLSRDEWQALADGNCRLPGRYVLVYSLKFDKWLMEQALAKARAEGAEVVLLGAGDGIPHCIPPRGVRYEKAFGPRQFIAAFSRADFVFTDSFHGSVFSVLFGKRFVVRALGENGQRMDNLGAVLGIGDRVFREKDRLPDVGIPIDYGSVYRKVEALRLKAEQFITASVQ